MTARKKKNKGGRGVADKLRNRAMVLLYDYDSEDYNPTNLARMFGIDRSTASRNVHRDREKYLGDKRVTLS